MCCFRLPFKARLKRGITEVYSRIRPAIRRLTSAKFGSGGHCSIRTISAATCWQTIRNALKTVQRNVLHTLKAAIETELKIEIYVF